jgi:hypothetical protein
MCRRTTKVKSVGGLTDFADRPQSASGFEQRLRSKVDLPHGFVVTAWLIVHMQHRRDLWRREQRSNRSFMMDELNGRMMACQILITGLIARVANNTPDPLRFLTEFRDEIRAVVNGVNIAGMDNSDRVRLVAQQTVDELFSLMKPPSSD